MHVAVERVEDRSSTQRIVDTVVFGVSRELCSRLRAGPYSPSVMRSSWEGDVALLRRGVTIAAVYQAESARTPEMLRYLADLAQAGAKVRVTRRISHRTIIVDGQVAALAVGPEFASLRRAG